MTIRLLYVDDNDEIREIAEMCLELSDAVEPRTCGSGREALEICRTWSPDLVLMDVMMPEMDGLTAFRIMQETPELKDIPVIFITARVQQQEVQDYMALGARGVIEKPFEPTELAERALRLIG